ncbi:MAG: aminoacyl-tRNA hydrolase [Bacteriovoracaceae bacterium]|nr:aminoacyl-tRNA hydrolase [Bacteriovoracaceae bacterium]
MPLLIVALGNPGSQYEETRHNIGWKVFDELSFQKELAWKEKFKGFFALKNFKDDQVIFLKPQTFMNLSGESVRPAMDFYKVPIENVLVIHDEIDLPFGTIHLKKGGGLAGNNGLKSIAQHSPNQDFLRLRMGIARPKFGEVSAHVLGQFSEDEKPFLDEFTKLGAEALEYFLKSGFQKAQNKYSKKTVLEKE